MPETRLISPMLDGFALGDAISSHSGVECFPAMRSDSDEHYILKTISVPASQVQLDALLLTGAFSDNDAALSYFRELADGIVREVEILSRLAARRGFQPYNSIQTVPMDDGVGYRVYLLNHYYATLERHLKRAPLTHLSAVNLGIDVCAALAVCREAGYLYVDLKPANIFLTGRQEYRIGDIGFVDLSSLKYASLPDRCRSVYTTPEVSDAYATLNTTMDTYALGLTLYQIYNNGALPFDSEAARQEFLAKLAAGEPFPAPANADYEMAQIIEKACALAPADRWESPVEMGQALISYMQRNGANDTPILPPVVPEPEPLPEPEEDPGDGDTALDEIPAEDEDAADETAAVTDGDGDPDDPDAEDAEDADEADEPADEAGEVPAADGDEAADAPAEDVPAEDIPADETADGTADGEDEDPADEGDWIDRMGAILAEDGDGTDGDGDDDEPSLRDLLETDELDEAEADAVTEEEITDDTAGILTQAQALIEHDAPAPVVAPAPIDVPIPEPIVLEPDPVDEEEPEDTDGDETDADVSDDADAADDAADAPAAEAPAGDKDEADDVDDDEPKPRKLRKFLGFLAGLLVTAGLAFGAWYYYQNYYLQIIDSVTVDGQENMLTVTVDTAMDQSLLTVVCKDTYGNPMTGKLENGAVTFTDLLPGTQYIISLEVEGFHKLEGASPATYYTPAETKIMDLNAVTGQEDGSLILSFGVEGADSDEWVLTCVSEGEEDRVVRFSGHSLTVTGLTVGKTYTLTVTGSEELYLVGEHSITHTASALILAENLTVSGYSDGSFTASWTAPEGISVERWVARCYNEEGYDQILEVTEAQATFTGITANAAYTLEVTAAGMTMARRTFVTANPITITAVNAEAADGMINLSWEFEGQAPEGGWVVLYTVDGAYQQILNTEGPEAAITPAAPGSHYDITIQTPDATSIFGGTAAVDVPDGDAFAAYGLNTSLIRVTTHAVPEGEDWAARDLRDSDTVTAFAPGGEMALLYYTTSRYHIDYTDVQTLFVIRDAEGRLVSTSTAKRTWADMWYSGNCAETVTGLPTEPGSYTLTVYLDGMKLTIQDFTVE